MNLRTEIDDNILTIFINREEKMNALNIQTLQDIKGAVEGAHANDDVHGIIINRIWK